MNKSIDGGNQEVRRARGARAFLATADYKDLSLICSVQVTQ